MDLASLWYEAHCAAPTTRTNLGSKEQTTLWTLVHVLQAFKAFERAIELGKELGNWSIQSEAHKGACLASHSVLFACHISPSGCGECHGLAHDTRQAWLSHACGPTNMST